MTTLYVALVIDCVEEDADFEALANATVADVQLAQPFHNISLNEYEVQ